MDDDMYADSDYDDYGGGFGDEYEDVSPEKPFEVMSRQDIMSKQENALEQTSSVTGLPMSSCRILLRFYRWDALKALSEWSDAPQKVLKAVGLPSTEAARWSDGKSSSSSSGAAAKKTSCDICFDDDVPPAQLSSLTCGHTFCHDCWRQYLSMAVLEKKPVITCPGAVLAPKTPSPSVSAAADRPPNGTSNAKCPLVVDELLVVRLLANKSAEERYLKMLMDSYVEDNPSVRWCPAANCQNAILLKEVSQARNECVECTCGAKFCFRCLQAEHRPASCQMALEWNKMNTGGDESVDLNLIAAISRPCPRCNAAVQKNGGCNHMSCIKCQYHFCWQCMDKFGSGPNGGQDGYHNHKCNGFYQEDDSVKSKIDELKKFEWYSERYNTHAKSHASEKVLLEKPILDAVLAALIGRGLSWVSAQFYTAAVQQLVDNRTTIMNSYAFAYFRAKYCPWVNKLIFEALQNDMENKTEMLAGLVQTGPKDTNSIFEKQQEIIHATKLAEKLQENLLNAASDWLNIDPEEAARQKTEEDERRRKTSAAAPAPSGSSKATGTRGRRGKAADAPPPLVAAVAAATSRGTKQRPTTANTPPPQAAAPKRPRSTSTAAAPARPQPAAPQRRPAAQQPPPAVQHTPPVQHTEEEAEDDEDEDAEVNVEDDPRRPHDDRAARRAREEEELRQATAASLKENYGGMPENMSVEDWELQMAIQASLNS